MLTASRNFPFLFQPIESSKLWKVIAARLTSMKKNSPTRSTQPLLIETTETEAGLNWLNGLPEEFFRDKILMEVFHKMQADGAITAFENIHGRNDKGVDYIVSHNSVFGSSIRGIQVKSKRMTRSESSGGLSAVRIRGECQAALLYTFHFQGRDITLDSIDIWCSAPVTEDAEKEINPPHTPQRICLKKDREILAHVEKYCPTLLTKIPQFAIAKYIAESLNPGPKAVRILGCNLNPSVNFIEPFFSARPPTPQGRIRNKNGLLKVDSEKLSISDIITEKAHTLILAPPLSGRTYLLEHIRCKLAEAGHFSVMLKEAEIPTSEFRLENVIAKHLGFASPKQVKELQERSGIVVLIDDLDKLSLKIQERLFANESDSLRIIASARNIVAPSGIKTFHMSGVDWISIVKFLRTVDNKLATGKPFVDRAKTFIDRAFEASGLPKNPFTIAIMLEECQRSVGKFNTPTMGRVIERFIELQLGSHSDTTYVVDFETKREFLTRLAGHVEIQFDVKELEKLLGKFIDTKGHPHSITDFSNDLFNCGVFQRTGDIIEWSHPVIKEFFWAKNLIQKKKLLPIQKKLEKGFNITLAAMVGSQLQDARPLLEPLLMRLSKIDLPSLSEVVGSEELNCPLSTLISDEDEQNLLTDLETDAFFKEAAEPKSVKPVAESDNMDSLSKERRSALKKRLDPVIKRVFESELHISFNVAALVLNARDTSRQCKEQSVDAVIGSCEQIARLTQDIAFVLFEDSKKVEFLSAWIGMLALCSFADELLGDPHLVSIFRTGIKRSKSKSQMLAFLDLLLCCGEDENKRILESLQRANHLGITMAFYWRIAFLYYFRFHRDVDRSTLRKLLSEIRKMEPHLKLPKVV